MDSPPSDATNFTRKRHHTPHTVPRTRLPPGTPLTERLAMESLRQQLAFDDEAEVSITMSFIKYVSVMERLSKLHHIILALEAGSIKCASYLYTAC